MQEPPLESKLVCTNSNDSNKPSFNKLLFETIQDTLIQIFGRDSTETIFTTIEKIYFLRRDMIPENHHIEIDVPENVPAGEAEVIVLYEPKNNQKPKNRKPGSAKGLIWMSEDFDEPLDDFKEYMP